MVTTRKHQSVVDGLEATLSVLELRTEASAHVAAMRLIAFDMDASRDPDVTARLAALFLRQTVELRSWVAPPSIEEDPFDALARSLASGDNS